MKSHGPMFQRMLAGVVRSLESVPEHRKGNNTQYEIMVQPAHAAGGAYTINFSAADPELYIPPIPYPPLTAPTGRADGDTVIPNAYYQLPGGADVKVESLAPDRMALGQIVPFEIKISVSGDTTPENGVIQFVAGWNIDTTNNDDFGYDESYGVYGAFIDTGDGAHVDPEGDATVDSFSWALVGDEIQGTFNLTGLDDGDAVVLEAWLVLEDWIPAKAGGNVASRLISAQTSAGDAISTGNQTVPLLQVGDFYKADADLSISKSDDPDPVVQDGTLTYTLVVLNSGPDIANDVQVVDTLDANTTFVSATVSNGGTCVATSGIVTCDLGAIVPGTANQVTVTIVVTVNSDAPTDSATGEDLWNTVTVSAITSDPDTSNNTATEPTDVLPANVAPQPRVVKGTVEGNDIVATIDEPGGSVTINVVVYNDAPTPSGDATLTSLVDDIYGDVTTAGHDGITATDCATGGLIPGGGSYACSFTVDVANEPATIVDTLTAELTNAAATVSDDDQANVVINDVTPTVDLVKDVSPASLDEPGGDFNYTLTIYNTSIEPVQVTALTDDNPLPAACTDLIGQWIPVGGLVSCSYVVNHTEPGSYGNTASVTVVDNESNSASDTDSETATVNDLAPTVDLVKDVSPASLDEPGGDFNYTLTFYNTSIEPVQVTALTDDNPLPAACTDLIGQWILVGGSVSCSYVVNHTEPGSYGNTASVTVVDDDGSTASDTDSETVTVNDVAPTVDLVKDVSPASLDEPGGDFNYSLTIYNTSIEPVQVTALTDDNPLPAACTDLIGQWIPVDGSLSCSYVVNHTEPGTYDNTASVTVVDNENNSASDTDSETVTVNDVPSSILTTKTASPTSVPETGGDVTFTIVVENSSLVDTVTINSVIDDQIGDVSTSCAPALPASLLPGESVTCSFTEFLSGDYPSSHTNVATAAGVDDDGCPVSDDDDETVTYTDVLPDITVTKTADPTSVPETGGDVTFTFVVTNDSDESVTITNLSDSVFGTLAGDEDCQVGTLLAAGGSCSFAITEWIEGDFSGAPHYDVFSASVVDNDGSTDTQTDDETVNFEDVAPSISVSKTADQEEVFAPGEDVGFTIVVTNNSLEDATIDELYDSDFDLATQCSDAVGTMLAYGESYTCVFSEYIAADHENTVTVVASDNDGNSDTDSATETVEMINPSVDIEKSTNGVNADDAPGPQILIGTTVNWAYVVTNNGDVTLTDIVVTDNQLGDVFIDCGDLTNVIASLAPDAFATCTASGMATAGQYANTGTADASYTDADGDVATRSDTDDSHYFGAAPSYTVTKDCTNVPVPQEGPATYQVSFTNTGNVPLSITADDGIGTFDLAVGETKTFDVSLAGPFSGQATVDNTVNASSTYTDDFVNSITVDETDSASCTVGGRTSWLKLTQDAVDPTYYWQFDLFLGPNDEGDSAFMSSPVASSSTGGDADGVLEFIDTATGYPYNLDPNQTYTVCELELPAGWATFWRVDTDNDGIVDSTVLPYNPNESDDPPEDLGNRCYDFSVGAGNTLAFEVRNYYPGGDPRTPGYWKNWNWETGGGQAENSVRNGGWMNGFWLVEDVLDPDVGGGILWDDILDDDGYYPPNVSPITLAAVAIDILDQREIGDPDVIYDGVKHSNDAAYTLAMHLLAAQLNFGAYAKSCDAARDAALAGEMLLDKYDFSGEGDYLISNDPDPLKVADYALALDLYNNGELCVGPGVNIDEPNGGTTFVAGDPSPTTIVVSVMDLNTVTQVEFLVDGVSLGVDMDGSDGWTMDWDWTTASEGSHVIEAIATNDLLETGSADVTVVVDQVADVFMHVGSLEGSTTPDKGGKWIATVNATIVDADGNPVADATVSGVWSNGSTATCTTGADGTCAVSIKSNKTVLDMTFVVTDVTHGTYFYDPDANVVTEITLYKP